jgi:hypothetical protein
MSQSLTPLQAYNAMFEFLRTYYERTNSDAIAVLLGGLAIANDGKPMDPGNWQDWENAIARALNRGQTS